MSVFSHVGSPDGKYSWSAVAGGLKDSGGGSLGVSLEEVLPRRARNHVISQKAVAAQNQRAVLEGSPNHVIRC